MTQPPPTRTHSHSGDWWLPLVFVGYTTMTAWFWQATSLAPHRAWATIALVGYAISLVVAITHVTRRFAPAVAVLGAIVLPLLWLVARDLAQPEVGVLADGAAGLVHRGTPYLDDPQALGDYRPYFPLLFVFGLPRALGVDGGLGDPRTAICVAFALTLTWIVRGGNTRGAWLEEAARPALLFLSFPLVSLSLVASAIDFPMIAACLASLVYFHRHQMLRAGMATGCAILMKPVALLLLVLGLIGAASVLGRRQMLRYILSAGAVILAVLVPILVFDPEGFVRNTLAFPAGFADVASPAQSSFPGVLLARSFESGTIVALAMMSGSSAAVVGYAMLRPPQGAAALAAYTATGLTMAFLLAPNSRAGYLALPIMLWLARRYLTQVPNSSHPLARPVP